MLGFALGTQADKDVRVPLPTLTLAFIPDMLSGIFAAMSLTFEGYRLANVFSQIVAIFAAIFTRVPGAGRRVHGSKRSDTNQKRQTPPKHQRGLLHDLAPFG